MDTDISIDEFLININDKEEEVKIDKNQLFNIKKTNHELLNSKYQIDNINILDDNKKFVKNNRLENIYCLKEKEFYINIMNNILPNLENNMEYKYKMLKNIKLYNNLKLNKNRLYENFDFFKSNFDKIDTNLNNIFNKFDYVLAYNKMCNHFHLGIILEIGLNNCVINFKNCIKSVCNVKETNILKIKNNQNDKYNYLDYFDLNNLIMLTKFLEKKSFILEKIKNICSIVKENGSKFKLDNILKIEYDICKNYLNIVDKIILKLMIKLRFINVQNLKANYINYGNRFIKNLKQLEPSFTKKNKLLVKNVQSKVISCLKFEVNQDIENIDYNYTKFLMIIKYLNYKDCDIDIVHEILKGINNKQIYEKILFILDN